MPWTNKVSWERDPHTNGALKGYNKAGTGGNHVSPTAYQAYFGDFPASTETFNGSYVPVTDVPGMSCVGYMYSNSVPFPAARNKAWGKLVDKVRTDPASLGAALAESGESLEMIASRGLQLYRGYRELRHGRFRGFLRTFGIGAKRRHKNLLRNTASQASSLWLEYSFGWSPLFKDIYEGLHAMGQPVPGGRVSGSGREDFMDTNYTGSGNTSIEKYSGSLACCKMGAEIYISNPNLYLAQQLGLANPLAVAWEIVPFSFVVDWVFDVGTCLGAISDLYGCEVKNPYTTYFLKTDVEFYDFWDRKYAVNGKIAYVKRKTGLDFPMPNVSFHANIGTSMKRAANAVSLLGQMLTK